MQPPPAFSESSGSEPFPGPIGLPDVPELVRRYLDAILPEPSLVDWAVAEGPTLGLLKVLQEAHLSRVPYETLSIHRLNLYRTTSGFSPSSISPRAAVHSVVTFRRGGYCLQLNAAFGALLNTLGYQVTWLPAWVEGATSSRVPSGGPNHLAIEIAGLPSDDNPAGKWLTDVGLPDGPVKPVPFTSTNQHRQGSLVFGMRESELDGANWRFDHDVSGSFPGMDIASRSATFGELLDSHLWLSTNPDSMFAQRVMVANHDNFGVNDLVGCVLKQSNGERVVFESGTDWYQAISNVFGLGLSDFSAKERDSIWREVATLHARYLNGKP